MASITFRGRKNGECFDAEFYLAPCKEGEAADVSSWHVGDRVGVCFENQGKLIEQVREHCLANFQFGSGSSGFLQVRCVVVERHHGILWVDVGRFEEVTACGVILEAENGYWEDVLRWVVLDQRPEWVSRD